MTFEAELKTHLQGDSNVSSLVDDRITPVVRKPEAALPAIVYQVIAQDPHNNFDGPDGSLRALRVQMDVWARTHSAVLEISAAVRTRMATAATNFRSVELPSSGLDDYEPETKLYRRLLEYTCWYRET